MWQEKEGNGIEYFEKTVFKYCFFSSRLYGLRQRTNSLNIQILLPWGPETEAVILHLQSYILFSYISILSWSSLLLAIEEAHVQGGMGTLFGPVLGAVGIILLRDIFSNFTESWSFIMGVLFMAAVLGFRSGLIGILRNKLRLSI